MGADHPYDEPAKQEVMAMSDAAKGYLGHHLNNSLTSLIMALELGDIDSAKKSAFHMVDDLNRVGINSGSGRPTGGNSVNNNTTKKDGPRKARKSQRRVAHRSVSFNGVIYRHEKLQPYNGKRVLVFEEVSKETVIVHDENNRFVCLAAHKELFNEMFADLGLVKEET